MQICNCGADKGDCVDCLREFFDSAFEVIYSTANFLRGMCFDPALPPHIKEAIQHRVSEMDEMLDKYSDE